MKLSLDSTSFLPRRDSAEAKALSAWYDARPTVKRLWAIRDQSKLNVIITLEPTVDDDDTYPAWLACGRGWVNEIQSMTGGTVSLEMLEEPAVSEFEIGFDGELVTALSWRDPTSFWIAD